MFCMNCGTEIQDGAKFCMKCGKPVGVVSEKIETNIIKEQEEIKENKDVKEEEDELDKRTGYSSADGKYAAGLILVYDGWSKFHNNQIGIMFIEKDSILIQFNSGGYKVITFSEITNVDSKKLSLMMPKKLGFEIQTRNGSYKFAAGEGGRMGRFYKWNANAWVNSINNAINNWKNNK